MHALERQRAILRALQGRAVVTISELAILLGTSEATVRRDLGLLAGQGALKRVRGGAAVNGPTSQPAREGDSVIEITRSFNSNKKRAIARAAAAMCGPHESIILGAGSTTYAMAEALEDKELQILTVSIAIARHLHQHTQHRVLIPGGQLHGRDGIILNPFERNMLDQYVASKLFLGAYALSEAGLMYADSAVLQAEKKLLDRAEQVIVLADSSKFHRRGSLILCPLRRISRIITDDAIDDAALGMLEASGVDVVVAQSIRPRDSAA